MKALPVRGPDGNYYMPCSSHSIYLRVTGQNKEEDLDDDAKAESDVDTTPTQAMAEAAERGLAMRKEFNRGGTEVGVARAVQLVSRERLSPRTVRRMHNFFLGTRSINVPKVSGKVRRLPKRRENCMVIMGRRCWAKLG